MAKRKIRKVISPYPFSFKVSGNRRRKTILASDIYDAGQELKKLFPGATELKLL